MIRFVLCVCMAFATAFVGVSWAARGFPFLSFELTRPMQPTVTATFGDQSAKDYERKMWEAEHTAQSDGDSKLDRIRLAAPPAGHASTLSPFGGSPKANLN